MSNVCSSRASFRGSWPLTSLSRQTRRIRLLALIAIPLFALGFSSPLHGQSGGGSYTLTVNGGSGSGSYDAGTIVNIEADPAPVGQEFDQWTGDVGIIADASAAATSITMPEGDATVTATYRARQYTLTVNNGAGSGSYPAGTVVNIVAAGAPAGLEFDAWTGDVGIVEDVSAASTTITMPEGNATVTATYQAAHYTLTVNHGTGSGSYLAGTVVNIVADPAPLGQEFDQWTGDTLSVFDVGAPSTSITMPGADATVTATYKARPYTLTVNGGSGSGSYFAGAIVNIVADPAPVGQEFDQWTGDISAVGDVNVASTSVTMPEGDVSVTATYKARQYTLTVNGGSGSGSYFAGAIVNIVADPAPVGQVFDQWTGDVGFVGDVNAAATSVTMPEGDVSVTATYQARQYTLTVNGGSGSGSYLAGAIVDIVADPAPVGQEFDQWTGDISSVGDVNAASTAVTMPEGDVSVTATYQSVPRTLTVNGGTGSGTYVAGTIVSIVAVAAPAGQEFDRWTGDTATVANVNASSTSITMPGADAAVTATYRARLHTLTVNSGTGSGGYAAGVSVNIVAVTAPAGLEFDRWTGDVESVANVNAASTSLTMPARDITVTANYKTRQYTLTVNSGTGSGSYSVGATVNIVAAAAPAGQEFDRWIGDVAQVLNVNSASTFFTMPAANVTVSATYRARQFTLTVNSGTGSGSYTAGTTVNIVAAPAPAGQEFDRWTGDISAVGNATAASTFLTMPTANTAVTATYRARQFRLTVNGGSGSGNYASGTVVNLIADAPPAGQEFDRWTGDVANVLDVRAESTSLTTRAADTTVTATYRTRLYALTVNSGSGSGSFSLGATVNIVAAAAPADSEFDRWTGDIANVVNVLSASTFITMPAADATVTATYKLLPRTLTVNGGSGSGSHVPGTSVSIVAGTAPAGQEFDQWTGDVANVADVNAATTTITMPLTDTTVTATYRLRSYALTVNSGTGSGSYLAGTIVDIEADPAPAGQEFDRWTGNVANLEDVNAASTSLTMPTAEVTVTAGYRLPGGVSGVGPLDFLTATGNAGLITSINGIPVADLVLGVTAFPTANPAFPAVNADNFDLGLAASADGQPYFDCAFAQPVTTVFLIENGGNDSGMVQGYDAAGNRLGPAVAFTSADYLRTEYRSGNNQVVAGLMVRLTAPVRAIRVLPPASGALSFDPLSISAVPESAPPVASLQWQWDPLAGLWQLLWEGDGWVLQQTPALDAAWSDVSPLATSPYTVTTEEPLRFYRLREAGPE